jgi:hypothetical protein
MIFSFANVPYVLAVGLVVLVCILVGLLAPRSAG